MNILVGVDGSQNGFEAVSFIGDFVDPARDRVGFAHSVVPLELGTTDVSEALVERARNAVAKVIFDEAREHLPENMRATAATFAGADRPAELIRQTAQEWPADLLVVGARGLGTIGSLLLGSVSNEVVRAATKPVLVVRKKPKTHAGLRVLVAFDMQNAERFTDILEHRPLPAGSQGYAIGVSESYYVHGLPERFIKRARDADTEAMSQVWVKEYESENAAKKTQIERFTARLPAAFALNAPILKQGNPAEQILLTIRELDIDLVIVGKQIKGRLDRLLLGSTSEKVLHHAPCSVLVVPG